MTALFCAAPIGRRTGRPRGRSQRCTVRTPFPRYLAISFQDDSTVESSETFISFFPQPSHYKPAGCYACLEAAFLCSCGAAARPGCEEFKGRRFLCSSLKPITEYPREAAWPSASSSEVI